ncbi:MAG: amidase, partial [Chloroflexi bacterium]|nr:amidase [Chloroflexota bacterium]
MTSADDSQLEEITIDRLQERLRAGELTSVALVEHYVDRIRAIDQSGPTLRSVLELNPEAEAIAAALDRERAHDHVRSLLHGIPVLIKDNIETADRMQTTAGSLALLDVPVEHDAPVAARLREAGAVILGKTNLSEWANFRSSRSSSGWSARGRQTVNPYVLDRTPGGSSSGSGVAVSANLAMGSLGSETDGSIMSPSSQSCLVGIKPTVGLTSREGVIPISHTQDTVGPHARTVRDAALVLSAIASSGLDYVAGLSPDALGGARIGVARRFFTGYSEHTDRVFERALDVLRGCGAELSDVDIPGWEEIRDKMDGDDNSEAIVLQYELKAGLAQYLRDRRPRAQLRCLADVIRFNQEHAADEMPYFAQELFERSEARGSLEDDLYQRALARQRSFGEGFRAFFASENLAAIVAPTNSPACTIDQINGDRRLGGSSGPAAVCGFPLVTVPAGFALDVLPIGLTFMGPPHSEP